MKLSKQASTGSFRAFARWTASSSAKLNATRWQLCTQRRVYRPEAFAPKLFSARIRSGCTSDDADPGRRPFVYALQHGDHWQFES